MTKFENMIQKYAHLKLEKNKEIEELKNQIAQMQLKLQESKFDNEMLTNDNEAKAFQLSRMEQKCQKFMDALDTLQKQREKDRTQ